MRGLITLATAFALPQQFPGRDLIVLCAFCVVLGTLVIQGCTLTLIVGFLPGFRSRKSGLLAACSAGYAALFAAATLAPITRALNSSTVITSAVEKASIVNVARWTSAADSAP
jgi:hypothetical protein